MIVSLKDKQYVEYKHKKQEYLIRIDFETINETKKENIIERYNEFYVSKMETIYKGLLKNYSVQLSDKANNKDEEGRDVYDKIFNALENYISDILPIKLKTEKENKEYKNIIEEYERYEEITIGKLDVRDNLKKKMSLLGLSRYLFTHSLPLIAAEECYMKLIQDGRELLIDESNKTRRDKTFELIVTLIEEYNVKLLSTKVYWERPEEREEHKMFWDKYKGLKGLNEKEAKEQKQILFLRYDLRQLNEKNAQYFDIIKTYKDKLVELGVMRALRNSYKAEGKYIKKVTVKK